MIRNDAQVTPFLSVLVPCRNEARFLAGCLESILANDYPVNRMEVLVIDGVSSDDTSHVIEKFSARDARIRYLKNPSQTAPHALNLGIQEARGVLIARVDAHATVAVNYFSRCVARLEETGADNVGGAMRTVAQDQGFWSEPILAALGHRFGVGNSYFRVGSSEARWVDTVFGGCWRRSVFTRVGVFNPLLRRSQDMEFSLRLKAAGLRTLLAPDIHCDYYARTRLGSFVRHNFLNGEWAILPFAFSTLIPVSLRHLIPLVFVVALAGCVLAASWSIVPLQWVGLSYLTVNAMASMQIAARKQRPIMVIFMPVVFSLLHVSYGFGSLSGLFKTIGIFCRGRQKQLQENLCMPQQ